MSIQMKKVLLTICAFFAYAYTAIAQVTVLRSELAGTKWQPAEVYGRPESSDCEFTKDAFIIHSAMGITIRRPFYLSNTIPAKFDFRKVGVSTKGRYFNEYLDENHFCCWAIMSFDKSKGKMDLELKNVEFIGPSTITYIRIDKAKY